MNHEWVLVINNHESVMNFQEMYLDLASSPFLYTSHKYNLSFCFIKYWMKGLGWDALILLQKYGLFWLNRCLILPIYKYRVIWWSVFNVILIRNSYTGNFVMSCIFGCIIWIVFYPILYIKVLVVLEELEMRLNFCCCHILFAINIIKGDCIIV